MSRHTTDSRGRSAPGALAIGGLLVVLYPMSLGPAIWLAEQGWLGQANDPVVVCLRHFYRPLDWCTEHQLPVISPLLNTYTDMWQNGS